MEQSASQSSVENDAVLGDTAVDGSAIRGWCDARLRHGRHLGRHSPNVRLAAGCRSDGRARHRRCDDQMRSIDDRDIYAVGECAQHRGQIYGLVAPLWEQAQGAGGSYDRHNPSRRLSRLERRDQAQGDGRRRRRDGRSRAPSIPTTKSSSYSEPKRGIYKKLIVRDGTAGGRILLGDISKARRS